MLEPTSPSTQESNMSQNSPLLPQPKRLIKVESRVRTGSDPTVYALKKSNLEKVPSTDNIIGQPCTKCTGKCHGYMPHVWRKKCITCSCARDDHLLDSDPRDTLVYLEELSLQNGRSTSAMEQRLKEKYSWYPGNLKPHQVEQYMQSLPKDKRPQRGMEGETYRSQQFTRQLPAYDTSLDACHKMADLDKKRMTKFIDRIKRRFFGVGEVDSMSDDDMACTECSELIFPGSLYVKADRAGDDLVWHPQCFKCETCQELLVDLIYFYSPENNVIYCGRHFGESLVPRCNSCDELIFSSTLTESKGKKYHKEHFCCSECDTILHDSAFREECNNLYCGHCYDRLFAAFCQKCKEPISLGAQLKSVKGLSWHAKCFVCKRCREDLIQGQYFIIKGDLLCSECVEPIAQCHSCKSAIVPTVSYFQDKNKTRTWHAECFKCVLCQAWLVDGTFHVFDDNLMCTPCYTEKVGKKCTTCMNSIVGKAVKFGFGTYHPDCFVCGFCGQPLVGGNVKVKEREGKPICQDCILRSAKKCFRCCQPITSKHTIYREHLFHLECFTCNLCGSSVATSEFFETSLGEILCQKCTKIK